MKKLAQKRQQQMNDDDDDPLYMQRSCIYRIQILIDVTTSCLLKCTYIRCMKVNVMMLCIMMSHVKYIALSCTANIVRIQSLYITMLSNILYTRSATFLIIITITTTSSRTLASRRSVWSSTVLYLSKWKCHPV